MLNVNSYIIYDGYCGFCNKTIMFIAKKDSKEKFLFVSNSSEFGIKLLTENNIKGLELESIILLDNSLNYYLKGDAIQRILLEIPFYNLIGYFMYIIPRFISNFIYMRISNSRKNFFKNKQCEIPNIRIRNKFIL